jgi:ankyrin repeat protein
VVQELLKTNKVDPAANNNFAIRLASRNGHIEVVQELLKTNKVDPAAENNYAIRGAIKNDHIEVVRELLSTGKVNPFEKGLFGSAYELAISENRVEIIKLFDSLKQEQATK